MRHRSVRLHLLALTAIPLLTGCSEAYWTANVREVKSLPPDSALLTNADIRSINRIEGLDRTRQIVRDKSGAPIVTTSRDGTSHLEREVVTRPRQFVCAEPSPDVARVVQAALSGSGAFKVDAASPTPAGLTGAKALDVEAQARLDASRSEAVAQLTRRIATIQLLRDGMYRACEAYANGAIGQEIYTAIVSRYDKMMVTMLLAEMASGNLPGQATASGESAAGAAGDPATASAKAQEARAAARTALEAAIEADRKARSTVIAKKEANDKVVANEKATEEEKRTAKSALTDAETAATAAEEKLVLSRRTSKEADEAAAAAATAARLGAGRTTTVSQAAVTGSSSATGEVANALYRMQREYLNDPQLGTQVLICAAEAAQPDPLQGKQIEFCRAVFAAAFHGGGTPATDRARTVQLAELKTQALARVLPGLPAGTSAGQRLEIIRMIRDMYQ